jgi:tetratricopeptide (TPR) repeat protein
MKSANQRIYSLAAAAAIICLLVYLPALFCDFVNWDDPNYIVDNPAIRILDRQFVSEAFTTSYMGWWMPLTWISFAIDYHFWGLNPFGFHLTNVLLHVVNTGLVVLVADGLLRGQVARDKGEYLYLATLLLAGLLWGLHPLRVESVAWVTERKDSLNGIFSLAAMLCYLGFVRRKDAAGYCRAAVVFYSFSLILLLFSLMAKPVSVVLPAMLLVADWYPLNRFRDNRWQQILLEKIPFVIMVVTLSYVTIHFAAGNQILVSYQDMPLSSRFLLAGNSLFEYCRLSLYPTGIIHLYLLPWPFPYSYAIKALLVAVFSCYCVWQCRKKPWLAAAWLAFVLPLAPVLGFFQNGAQSHAARFTYLSGIAFSICGALFIAELYSATLKKMPRFSYALLTAFVVVPLLICTAITELNIASWKNSETLWSRVIAIRPMGRAYYRRADYYMTKGRFVEAAADLLTSIDMGKKAGYTMMFNLHALRGDALNKSGRSEEAAREFTNAIQLRPSSNYFYHRGLALQRLGRVKEGEDDFLRAGDHREPIEWREK